MATSARRRLLIALASSEFAADELCRQALEAGAEAGLPDMTAAVARLETIYTRRVEHLRSRAIAFVGEDCPTRLRASGLAEVRLALVSGADYNFAVFLAPEKDEVVSCLAVDSAAAGPPDLDDHLASP